MDYTGNVITFEYNPNTNIEYVVNYVDMSGNVIADQKLVTGQTMDTTVTET